MELCFAFAQANNVQIIVDDCLSVLFHTLADLLPLYHAQLALGRHEGIRAVVFGLACQGYVPEPVALSTLLAV